MTQGPVRAGHGLQVALLSLGAGLPGAITALILLFSTGLAPKVSWSLTALILGCWLGLPLLVHGRVTRPLQTISNLLCALREGDFSLRGRLAAGSDVLGSVVAEINALGEVLRSYRLDAREATTLVRKVMEEIDVALFAFDEGKRLRLINHSGEVLLSESSQRLLGCKADRLGMGELLSGDSPRTVATAFPGGTGRWELRRGTFRQGGVPHTLVVLANMERALRQEERQAWQRLVRVLGHEINNSLAPIRSLAVNLQDVLAKTPPDWEDDVRRGLTIIARRSDGLNRFMTSYAELARLPPPKPRPVEVGSWIRRVAELEARTTVQVLAGPEVTFEADPDQLDQVLINLVRNAADAARETGGTVQVQWDTRGGLLGVEVTDEGPGIADSENLFVPFFTTKPDGSGIGLALSRQIAEAHRGTLTLENRSDAASGCVARLMLPVGPSER
ncbi:MAG: ATP-binding protein [Myxococcales bacterium]|nr:ATP-binding protein [Myxococcales bacterium]